MNDGCAVEVMVAKGFWVVVAVAKGTVDGAPTGWIVPVQAAFNGQQATCLGITRLF